MALRQLKRLQQQHQLELENNSEEDEASPPPVTSKPNLFQLLGEEEAASEGDDSEEESQATPAAPPQQPVSAEQRRGLGKSAKKRHKKKANKVATQAVPAKSLEKPEEDLDKLLESMNIKLQTVPERAQGEPSTSRPISVLMINPRKLNPDEELKRIFGSKIVNAEAREQEDDGSQFAGASRRVRRLVARGILQRVQLKPGIIIRPRDHWPRPDGALTMVLDGRYENGHNRYRYVHTPAYKVAQRLFEQAQASYDPNQVLELLNHHPYHVDALLAASDLYRTAGQHDTADDMLARCLYGLEMAWPSQFFTDPARGMLSIEVEENLPLFKALFRHVQMLIKRGLYATALENAKLLLGFNLADPTGVLMCIDYIAIKAGLYNYVQEFVSELDPTTDAFAFLPNWAFSTALAAFLQQKAASGAPAKTGAAVDPIAEGAKAVMQNPTIVPAVLEKLEEQGVHKDAEFQKLLKHSLFHVDEAEDSASLSHLVAIYAERQASLYKNPELLGWLKECCKAATAPEAEAQRLNWLCMREQIWEPSTENMYAHLRLSSFSDSVAGLPPEEVQAMLAQRNARGAGPRVDGEMVVDLDDLQNRLQNAPPEIREELRNLVDQPEVQNIAERVRNGSQVGDEELQQLNPLMALLQTILPWINYGRDPNDADGPPAPDAGT